jgi:hypothetical protein
MTENLQSSITPLPIHYEKHMDERHADLKDRLTRFEQHVAEDYTSKSHFYWILGLSWVFMAGTLCTAYYKVNPSEIKSTVSNVEYKLDTILKMLQSK